jgi:putative oxidoreductase
MTDAIADAVEAPRTASPWRIPLLVGRLLLGGIFVYAAYTKLHFDGRWHLGDYHFFFAMAIDSYHMLPLALVQWMARALPWIELALGAMLILGAGLRWSASMTSALLLVFIAAMTRAKMLGLEINCGCFGNNEKLGTATLLRDSSLLLLAVAVTTGAFLVRRRRRSPA